MIKKTRLFLKNILTRALFCIAQHRLPFRSLRRVSLVNRVWYNKLEKEIKITRKIKLGFGPIISGEDDLHVRKWRIDPIVNCINETSQKYCAGVFLDYSDMAKFDIGVIVREIDGIDLAWIKDLKNNKKFIYDIVDRPYLKGYRRDYAMISEFLSIMDGLIVSSPLQAEELKGLIDHTCLIEHPILNKIKKDYAKINHGSIRLIWQGYAENRKPMEAIHSIIERLARELNKSIKIVYLTNLLPRNNSFVEFKIWTVRNWEKVLVDCDIAVENKVLDDPLLQRKPATKILSYMAAGLPVVCTPSAADKLVIEHEKTGYFAYSEQDWYTYLKKLIQDEGLRRQIGEAASKYAINNFNINKITQKYLDFFDEIA